jgi:hypothetical protein
MEKLPDLQNVQSLPVIDGVDVTSLANNVFSLLSIFGLSEQAASISNIIVAIFIVLTSLGYVQKIKNNFSKSPSTVKEPE